MRLSIFPGALTAVLFPTFAASPNASDSRQLFLRATAWLALIMLPITVLLVVLAYPSLTWWTGSDFAAQSALVLQILTVGMFINCLAHIPYTWLQGTGRARTVAVVHLIELPIFIVLLVWLINQFGFLGAACAWFIRVVADAGILFSVSQVAMRDNRALAITGVGELS